MGSPRRVCTATCATPMPLCQENVGNPRLAASSGGYAHTGVATADYRQGLALCTRTKEEDVPMAPQRQQAVHGHGEGGAMRYVFDDCELDAARCELRCTSQTVLVEPKVFNVL